MSARQAYSSVVFSRRHVTVGGAIALLAGVGLGVVGHVPIWVAAGTAIIVALAAVYISTVRLAVGGDRITIGLGPIAWRARGLATSDVIDAQATSISGAQVFGLGLPWHSPTTRLTVRPGPTLVLRLVDGEVVRVSTPEPELAVQLIPLVRSPEEGDTHG
jgi:hypothetical protein